MKLTIFAHYYDQHMMESETWGFGFVIMVSLILAITLTVIYTAKSTNNKSSRQGSNIEPLDIAKSRYAKGEITKAQFDEMKKDLK